MGSKSRVRGYRVRSKLLSMFIGDPKPAGSAAPGILLEMKILRFHPKPLESETLGAGVQPPVFQQPSRAYWCGPRGKHLGPTAGDAGSCRAADHTLGATVLVLDSGSRSISVFPYSIKINKEK